VWLDARNISTTTTSHCWRRRRIRSRKDWRLEDIPTSTSVLCHVEILPWDWLGTSSQCGRAYTDRRVPYTTTWQIQIISFVGTQHREGGSYCHGCVKSRSEGEQGLMEEW
jgi:hypothetical protein